MFFVNSPASRRRPWLPLRNGTPSVPVGVSGTPLTAVVETCHGDHDECSPYGDGRIYGDGELYCSSDGGKGFYLCLTEVEPHLMSIRVQHSNGTQLIVDTIKPYLKPNPQPRPYNSQVDIDSNCPQHLSFRLQDSSGSQVILYRMLPFVSVRRNRPVA